MAEHWARHLAAKHGIEGVFASAGTKPAIPNPRMLRVMQAAGVNCDAARSQHIDDFIGEEWDLAVTLCDSAAQACPVFAGAKKREHHPFNDPAAVIGPEDEVMKQFEIVSEQIHDWVLRLLQSNN